MNRNEQEEDMNLEKSHFSFWSLGLLVVGHIVLLCLPLYYIFPQIWEQELATGFWAIFGVFVLCHLGNGFFELFFHRYVLHAVMFPWLATFARKHRHHHGLTPVIIENPKREEGAHPLRVNYAIETEEQEESSAFPPYALIAFIGIFTVPIVLFKLLLPDWPIVIGGYAAIIFSYTFYEGWHAVEHFPYESFWKPKLEHPRFGHLVEKVYGYHQMHHASYQCNEAISGFFGLPLCWLFGVMKMPEKPFVNGDLAKEEDLAPPRPYALIRYLDRLAVKREDRYKKGVTDKALRDHRVNRWIIDHKHLLPTKMLEQIRYDLGVKLSLRRLKQRCKQLQRKELIRTDPSG